jgi:hypothetical protein
LDRAVGRAYIRETVVTTGGKAAATAGRASSETGKAGSGLGIEFFKGLLYPKVVAGAAHRQHAWRMEANNRAPSSQRAEGRGFAAEEGGAKGAACGDSGPVSPEKRARGGRWRGSDLASGSGKATDRSPVLQLVVGQRLVSHLACILDRNYKRLAMFANRARYLAERAAPPAHTPEAAEPLAATPTPGAGPLELPISPSPVTGSGRLSPWPRGRRLGMYRAGTPFNRRPSFKFK